MTIALPLLIALLAPAENAVVIKKLGVPRFAHGLAADQYRSPGAHGLANAFDGDPATVWWLPTPAIAESGYTVDVQLATPVQIDQLRITLDPPVVPNPPPRAGKKAAPPAGRPGRLTSVELNFWDKSLSTTYPIYKRSLSLPADRPFADLGIPETARWNSALINDETFGDKRRAKGYGNTVPFPPTIDALTIVVQGVEPGELPPMIAEVQFLLHKTLLPIADLSELKAKQRAFIENGLRHIVEGRYFVGPDRTLQFSYSGGLYEFTAANWAAGNMDEKHRKKLGTWRIEAARLEIQASTRAWEPVDYTIDEAPGRVLFRTNPVAGEFAVATRAPVPEGAAAPPPEAATPAPNINSTPGFEPPPLVE